MFDQNGASRDSPHAAGGIATMPTMGEIRGSDARRAERLLGTSMSMGYHPQIPVFTTRGAEVLGWYFFADVEVMLMHSSLAMPLMYVEGPLGYAEWEIEASSRAAALWGANQLRWYWQNAWPNQQHEAYVYGWAATELVWVDRDGLLCMDEAITFSPRDVTPLVMPDGPQRGKPIGVRVVNQMGATLNLWAWRDNVPNKCIWYAHKPRGALRFGESQVRPAWRFWRTGAGADGIEEVIALAAHRFGTGVVVARHPNMAISAEEAALPGYQSAGMVHTRDIARYMTQNLRAGAGITLSSEAWPTNSGMGGPKWDLEVKQFATNLADLIAVDEHLAKKCSHAMGVPKELFEAAQTGSGYSGRAIPLQGFLMSQQSNLQRATTTVMNQAIVPACRWNFGPKSWIRATPKPLTESVRKSSWEAPGQGDPAAQPPPQAMSQGVDLPPAGGAPESGGDEGGGQPAMMSRGSKVTLTLTQKADGTFTATQARPVVESAITPSMLKDAIRDAVREAVSIGRS